jgi:hypothetical protein
MRPARSARKRSHDPASGEPGSPWCDPLTGRCLSVAILAGVLGTAACGGIGRWTEQRRLDAEAERYVRIVLALGDRDPDSLDFYAGPPDWQAQAHAGNQPLGDIKRSASVLLARIADERSPTPEHDARRHFLMRQLRAVVARIDLLSGRRLSFDEESRLLFGADSAAGDRVPVEGPRADLDRLLPAGRSLDRRYAAFDRRFVIPRDHLPDVMARAIDGCRRVTLDHMSLPAGERVSVEYVSGMPWSAFTRYEGHARSRIQINTDFDLTIDRALQLACHEAYPGHHVINSVIDAVRPWPELTVLPMFSPQALRTEGAATFAAELAFPDSSRLGFERDELFPLAALDPGDADRYLRVSRAVDRLRWLQADIARRYLDGELEFARAAAALEEEALMPSAVATLKFFNEFRSYAVTYTVGRDLVARYVDSHAGATGRPGAIDARWRAYERWITETK